MSRLEKYRLRRNLRRRYLLSALMFFLILTAGLFTADYSTNALMTGRRGIELLTFNNGQDYLEISLLNQRIRLNTRYVERDLKRLGNELTKLFNGLKSIRPWGLNGGDKAFVGSGVAAAFRKEPPTGYCSGP